MATKSGRGPLGIKYTQVPQRMTASRPHPSLGRIALDTAVLHDVSHHRLRCMLLYEVAPFIDVARAHSRAWAPGRIYASTSTMARVLHIV